MKDHSSVPDLSDSALQDHIDDLQSELDKLTISLQLATAEKQRRLQPSQSTSLQVKSENIKHQSEPSQSTSFHLKSENLSPSLRIGSRVKILNKYKGNKGKIGTVIDLSERTATVHIPQKGNFIKYLNNLELLPDQHET